MKDQLSVDAGKGHEGVGAIGSVALAEKSNHSTLWYIDKYDSDIHENKVKTIKHLIGEMLILANHHWSRGDKKLWFHYVGEARKLQEDALSHTYDHNIIKCNILLNEGIDEMVLRLLGSGGTAYNNATAQLGVGDSLTAEDATQTGLQAPTNFLYKGMNAGFPTSGTQQATWQSDFGASEANHLWAEFSVRNGATADINLNRRVSNQGTKISQQTWTLTLGITWS